ncbi:MAG: hypothetical protein KGK11_12900 [Sphingomonadales bacterium]|nr:hypothetical protein [Sphingomonadales bacterium]
MRLLIINAVAILVSGSTLSITEATAANVQMLAPKVKAGQNCPNLAPVNQWAHRVVRNDDGELLNTQVFCGDFNADGRADAVAFVHYNPKGANGIFAEIALFHNLDGRLQYLRPVKSLFGDPQDASFSAGRVVLDMLILKDTDAACCPSGRSHVAVDVATGTSKPLR